MTLTVSAIGNNGQSDSSTFSITVNEVPTAPVLAAIGNKAISEGQLLSFAGSAADQDLPANTLRFRLGPGAPDGAAIDPITGLFTWTPTEQQGPSIASASIIVEDGTGQSDFETISINVTEANGVTDNGNPALNDFEKITITVEACVFDDALTDWTVNESGGSTTGHGTVTAQDCIATLTEGDSFTTTLSTSFVVPANATSLSFTYKSLSFDMSDPAFINDAFEVALVDSVGNSVVPTYAVNRDAFFNITEDVGAATGSGVTVNGTTITLDTSGIPVGETATVMFRLANNDSDTLTSITITDFRLTPALSPGASNGTALDPASNSILPVDDSGPDLTAFGFLASIPTGNSLPVTTSSPMNAVTSNAATFPSNLELTQHALDLGFEISTFASGFPSSQGIGPLGIAFANSEGVFVTDYTGNLWRFNENLDGQSVADATLLTTFGSGVPIDLAVANDRLYITTRDAGGRLLELNPDGTVAQEIATGLGRLATGIVANPVRDLAGHQHLFVASLGSGVVWDIDPVERTRTQLLSVAFDGLSTDGHILYGAAYNSSRILGYDIGSKALVFDSGTIPGRPDGTALGTGTLAGKLYANTNSAGVWEIDLATKTQVQLAGGPGTSRGDFVKVAPDGSLLITQTDQIARLIPPLGGGFGITQVGINVASHKVRHLLA